MSMGFFMYWQKNLIPLNLQNLLKALVFLFPIFFLTIKGWVNTISILLFLLALLFILRDPAFFFKSRSKLFWVFFVSLLLPFLAELVVQISRSELVGRTLDGPSRFLAAAIFFVFLTRVPLDLSRYISAGALVGVCTTIFSVFVFTDYYWAGRAATYFVDPITLPVFLIAMLSLVQPSLLNWKINQCWACSIIFAGVIIFLVATVSLISQSRTSWVAFLALTETIIFLVTTKNRKLFIYLNIALLGCVFFTLLFSELAQLRIFEIFDQTHRFIQGDGDSSIGVRLGLILIDIKLFFEFPLFGVADGNLPPAEWFSARGLDVSPLLYKIKSEAGSHSEIFAHLSRKGIFGVPVIFSLFLVPIFYFLKFSRNENNCIRANAEMGLKFSLVIFLSSLFIQVFNLKMTSTFFAFILAIIFASLIKNNED
jgi:O-antigen ligase